MGWDGMGTGTQKILERSMERDHPWAGAGFGMLLQNQDLGNLGKLPELWQRKEEGSEDRALPGIPTLGKENPTPGLIHGILGVGSTPTGSTCTPSWLIMD